MHDTSSMSQAASSNPSINTGANTTPLMASRWSAAGFLAQSLVLTAIALLLLLLLLLHHSAVAVAAGSGSGEVALHR